jgi:hypothetical protein
MIMQPTFGQVQERTRVRPAADGMLPATAVPAVKEIPYDYVARFTLNGQRAGNRVQDVINISTDGAFVAVSIGYSFIPATVANVRPVPPDQRVIDFLYSIIDSGSGRELQNRAIHNIAGLGESNGNRPFRPLAKPMLFIPRSTIRIEVEEVSVDDTAGAAPFYQGSQLFIVFHGYKMLGYGSG